MICQGLLRCGALTEAVKSIIMNIVQKGGSRINTIVTSREAILQVCRRIVSEKGLSALNMRAVAQDCGVALGSLYHYFSSKDELVLATIESVWQDIFQRNQPTRTDLPFPEYVEWIFESVRNGVKEYLNFFTAHSLSVARTGKSNAKDTMEQYLSHLKTGMAEALHADSAVRSNAFSAAFSEQEFLDFVLTSLLVLLVEQKKDCHVLTEMIRRTIYKV